ncbi:MAG: YHS domain-containing protein [Nitrospirae bacterium]|nr:YHS domain-containing protein [Nitrospirota bacterium]MCL5237612.1 YHS domain-containing protein [Nitrospirota bacterium]
MFKKTAVVQIAVVAVFGTSSLSFAVMHEESNNQHSSNQEATHQEHNDNRTVPEQANTAGQGKRVEEVGNKVCPVSGETIDEKAKETYEYKGKIYNFCCPMCIEEFKKDPGKYIEKMEKEKAEESKHEHSTQEEHHHHTH